MTAQAEGSAALPAAAGLQQELQLLLVQWLKEHEAGATQLHDVKVGGAAGQCGLLEARQQQSKLAVLELSGLSCVIATVKRQHRL